MTHPVGRKRPQSVAARPWPLCPVPTRGRKVTDMPSSCPTTTILLIDSPHANWERLRVMLRKQQHFQIIGEVREGDEAVRAIAAE